MMNCHKRLLIILVLPVILMGKNSVHGSVSLNYRCPQSAGYVSGVTMYGNVGAVFYNLIPFVSSSFVLTDSPYTGFREVVTGASYKINLFRNRLFIKPGMGYRFTPGLYDYADNKINPSGRIILNASGYVNSFSFNVFNTLDVTGYPGAYNGTVVLYYNMSFDHFTKFASFSLSTGLSNSIYNQASYNISKTTLTSVGVDVYYTQNFNDYFGLMLRAGFRYIPDNQLREQIDDDKLFNVSAGLFIRS